MAAHSDSAASAGRPWWRNSGWWLRAVGTYALTVAAGAAARSIGLPLPWMLGPFFACGLASAFGAPVTTVPLSRNLGQLAIGLSVGLRFTPATLAAAASLLPAMAATTLYVIAFTFLAAMLFEAWSGVDRITAFFATAAGGMAAMAQVAAERGGDAAAVSIVHALRVTSTVALVPVLVTAFGSHGSVETSVAGGVVGLGPLALAIAGGVVAACLLVLTPMPNPWLLGPMFLGLVLGVFSVIDHEVPAATIVLAQIALGTWLGTRFRRETLTAAPRVAAAGVAAALFMIAAAGLGAGVLSALTELPPTTSFLAMAPAAVTEMVITARVMDLNAELVTAFHVMRIVIVSSTILVVYAAFERVRGGRGRR